MKISILLPYKENFSPDYAGAVSLNINDTLKISKYKKNNLMKDKLIKLFNIGYHIKFASSSSKRGSKTIENLYKYKPISNIIKTDEEERKIYENIKNKDAIEIICKRGGLRTILLSIK